jgi:hypothetical protein
MGPGMDDHMLVGAEQLVRKIRHALNADTPARSYDCR